MQVKPSPRSTAKIWAVVPIKETAGAKQRLAQALSVELRRSLALAMAEDVLAALAAADLAGIAVVTTDPAVADLARRFFARIIDDPSQGETIAVNSAARILAREGHRAILVVPADIPLVTESEIERLIDLHQTCPEFIIAPAHDELGSNAVLCAPPTAVPLEFGDNSFVRHLETARRRGITPKIVHLPGIGLDIDHPRDLARFMQTPSQTRTYAMLKDAGTFTPERWLDMAHV
jgi:2-phospho-L-lactate guanylyltransferase